MTLIKGGARKKKACVEQVQPICTVDDDFGFDSIDVSKVSDMLEKDKLSSETEKTASEEILDTPVEGVEAGMSDILTALIKDEWEAIEGYNSAIVNAKANGLDAIADVLTRIQNEENKHVGQLEKCLKSITPSVENISVGYVDADKDLVTTVEVTNVDDDTDGLEALANAVADMYTN